MSGAPQTVRTGSSTAGRRPSTQPQPTADCSAGMAARPVPHPTAQAAPTSAYLAEVGGLEQLLQQDDVGSSSSGGTHQPLRLTLQGGRVGQAGRRGVQRAGGRRLAAAEGGQPSPALHSAVHNSSQRRPSSKGATAGRTRLSSVSQEQAICVAATTTRRGAAAVSASAPAATGIVPPPACCLCAALGDAVLGWSLITDARKCAAGAGRGLWALWTA